MDETSDLESHIKPPLLSNDKLGKDALAEIQVLSFNLGPRCFGLNIKFVTEIVRQVEVTDVPESPDFVEGIIDVRGRIVPLISLGRLLRIEDRICDLDTEIIIADIDNAKIGLIVDKVSEIIPVQREKIIIPDNKTMPLARYLCGIVDLEQRLVLLLDLSKIVDFENETVSEKMQIPRRPIREQTDEMNREREILHDRAIELRKRIEEDNVLKKQLVIFSLGNEWYGLDIERVSEIADLPDIYYIPSAPRYITGAINLRGMIIALVDLKKFFELPETESKPGTSIIVVEQNYKKMGFIVESVTEIVELPIDLIEPPLVILDRIRADYLEGEAEWDKKLLGLVNLENIVRTIAQADG